MANFNFTLKRGVSGEDTLFPQTTWTQVLNKPTTFTPTAHTHAAADITSGTMATARLGSGTANTTTFLRGDGQWITPAGGGDVVGPASAVTGRVATFNGTTGKLIQDGGTLLSNLVSGPTSAVSTRFASFNGTTGKIIQDSGFTSGSFAAATHNHAASAITSGNFGTSIFNTTLATNTTSTTITANTYTRLIIYGSMSGFTTIRIMFPINYGDIANSTTIVYRYIWNNGTSTIADSLTINKNSSGNFTFSHNSGNSPWTFRIYGYERI
jgi:hypothetical protein